MNKSINILIEETKQSIVDVVNNCNLPMSVIELILENICFEVNQLKITSIAKEQKMLQEQKESTSQE